MTNMLRNKKAVLLTILLTLCVCLLFARAGGGGGSGGSSSSGGHGHGGGGGPFGFIGLIIWGLYTVVLTVVLFWKKKSALKVIAVAKDDIWNLEHMQQTVENTFYAMQDAWMERDLLKLSKIISCSFYNNNDWQLQNMKANHEKNILENITISSIQIISCRDYREDYLDTFSAFIKGTMIDYTIDDRSGEIIKGSSTNTEKFKDLYVFTRDENTWVLNQIVNDPDLISVLEATSITEEEPADVNIGL